MPLTNDVFYYDRGGCFKCKDGFYGKRCDLICPVNCRGFQCTTVYDYYGKCRECTNPGWFGRDCDKQCIANCKLCYDNSTCVECADGFYGDTCNSRCPSACTTCAGDGSCKTCVGPDDKSGSMCQCSKDQCATFENRYEFDCTACKADNWYIKGK